jgi:hypothetical protein
MSSASQVGSMSSYAPTKGAQRLITGPASHFDVLIVGAGTIREASEREAQRW